MWASQRGSEREVKQRRGVFDFKILIIIRSFKCYSSSKITCLFVDKQKCYFQLIFYQSKDLGIQNAFDHQEFIRTNFDHQQCIETLIVHLFTLRLHLVTDSPFSHQKCILKPKVHLNTDSAFDHQECICKLIDSSLKVHLNTDGAFDHQECI